MNPKTKEFRKQITDIFIKSLEEKAENWERPWSISGSVPINAATNRPYNGLNRLLLTMIAQQKGCSDPRWATFVQIKKNGWHLNAGSKGVQIEYWMPYDFTKKAVISWEDYKILPTDEKAKIGITPKYYTVFSAADISGIPPQKTVPTDLHETVQNNIRADQVITKLSQNMGVPIYPDGQRAFYRPKEDAIHTPSPAAFKSSISYNTTCLHELAHATGAAQRLNRDILNSFGTANYAYEELVAEITSAFMAGNLKIQPDERDMLNHKAYIQSWIAEIKEKPTTLMLAIKEATKAADYMEYKAELIKKEEYEKRISNVSTAETHESKEIIKQEIVQNGYSLSPALISNLNIAVKSNGIHSLKDIAECYKKDHVFRDDTIKSAIMNIGHELATQEKMMKSMEALEVI